MPNEMEMRRLARENPAELLSQLGKMKPYHLTYAAEALGQAEPTDEVIETLEELAQHDKAYVREGASHGLVAIVETLRARCVELERTNTALNETVRALRDGKTAPHYCAYCMENVPPTAMIAHMANCEKHPAAVLSGQLVEVNERVATLEAERYRLWHTLDRLSAEHRGLKMKRLEVRLSPIEREASIALAEIPDAATQERVDTDET